MAIDVMQRFNQGGDPEKGVKVPGTGLVLYPGGTQKTPTGLGNAFSESGLTADDILAYAKKYNLPTTSNKAFQEAQYNLLNKTPEGRASLSAMERKYGLPKAGKYADDILGARTIEMMMATNRPPEEHIPREKNPPNFKLPPPTKISILKRKGAGEFFTAARDQPNAIFNPKGAKFETYGDLQNAVEQARLRGIYTQGPVLKYKSTNGEFDKDEKGNMIPISGVQNLDYDFDVFSAYDLPHEESDFEGTGWSDRLGDRTKTQLGVMDKKTGKFVPYSFNKGRMPEVVSYLKKMINLYPEKFDLSKSASNYGRTLSNEKNMFHPDNASSLRIGNKD